MNRISIRTFVATLSYYSIDSGQLTTVTCRECRSFLDLHQPNPQQSDKFLGTCPDCGRWYRVESSEVGDKLTVLQLPEVAEIEISATSAGDVLSP